MRSIPWIFVLTPLLCTPAAFAVDRASVNMPFSFESHGKIFPASEYDVILRDDRAMLTLTSRTNPHDTITWITFPAEMSPHDTTLSIQFDRVGDMEELHTVRLGKYQTPVLDPHFDPHKNRVPAQSGQ
jgi:hypothetical protein